MSGVFGESSTVPNPWDTQGRAAPPAPPEASEILPPLSDIHLRTMASDLASLAASGGNQPQAQFLTISSAADTSSRRAHGPLVFIVKVAATGAGVVGLGLAFYYFVFPYFSGARPILPPPQTFVPPAANVPPTPGSAPIAAPAPIPANFTHTSFLRTAADENLSFTVGGIVENAADLQTYSQKLITLIGTAKATSTFIEITTRTPGGNPLSFSGFLDVMKTTALSLAVAVENFEPDFTFFVYKNKSGAWPGYIARLKPEKNWLFLKQDVIRLETRGRVDTLFLSPPGAPDTNGFRDATVADQQFRALRFDLPGAEFFYGFTRGYFFLSASREGLAEALKRL